MKMIKDEKQLLNFIKYSPIIVIFTIAILINISLYIQNEQTSKQDLKVYETNFIETNKYLTKIQVEKVYQEIQNERHMLEDELKNRLKQKVYEAYNIVDALYTHYANKPKEELYALIKVALRDLRFNDNRGYFYIYEMSGINVLHPIRPEFEGKSLLQFQDKRNQYIIQQTIEGVKESNDFFKEIYWVKPNDLEKEYKKITFNKYHKGLNVFIGTGEYVDDFTTKLKSHMLEYIQKIFYGKNGYVFVFDYNGVQLAHIKREYVGQNRFELEDANGKKITQAVINKAKEGEGFVQYIGTVMPQTGKPASKITYVKGLQEWNWAIGSGFYNNEMLEYLALKEEDLKKRNYQNLFDTALISTILTLILMLLAWYISSILKKFFNHYHAQIRNEIKENRKKDMLLYQQSKMASMGEMIGNIAHQWRQPLNLISTATSRIKLEEELQILTKETHKESLDAILKSTEYLSKTIDDFRDFFNPNKTLKTFSTQELYDKTMLLLLARLKNKNIEIIPSLQETTLSTYENELIQVLINILNNAIDAFEDKNIENKYIFLSMEHQYDCNMPECQVVECTQKEQGGYLIITIKDNAGGIQQNHLNKIFDAYFTTKHQAQGTGIGLYMSYQIMKKPLLGHISVSNETFTYKGVSHIGAKFTLILPMQ